MTTQMLQAKIIHKIRFMLKTSRVSTASFSKITLIIDFVGEILKK
jgi:hypothetical protein